MKALLKSIICTSVWIIAATDLPAREHASSANKKPRWISDKGFWQIEFNIHSPENSVVYFYNNESTLVYKENVYGMVLDLNKKRVKMKLKKALESALAAWNKNHVIQRDQQLVNMLFRKSSRQHNANLD